MNSLFKDLAFLNKAADWTKYLVLLAYPTGPTSRGKGKLFSMIWDTSL